MSVSIHRLPSFWAATSAKPQPQIGSSNTSPGFDEPLIRRSTSAAAFWVEYPRPLRCYGANRADIGPQVLQGYAGHFISVSLVCGHLAGDKPDAVFGNQGTPLWVTDMRRTMNTRVAFGGIT